MKWLWLYEILRTFEIDHRSFRLFRIILGIGVFQDLLVRMSDVEYFYSNTGILTPHYWEEIFGVKEYYWSFHLFPDNLWGVQLIIIFQMVLATCLITGRFLQPAFFLLSILSISLSYRNPMFHYGGDKLLGSLLMIGGLITPLEDDKKATREWSLKSTQWVRGLAILLQMCFLYCCSGESKSDQTYWLSGDALYNALFMTQIVKPFGVWFSQFKELLNYGTKVVVPLEMYLPWVMFIPFFKLRLRTFAILILLGLNLGIFLMLEVSFFMAYATCGLILLLPASFWEDLIKISHRIPSPPPFVKKITANVYCRLQPSFSRPPKKRLSFLDQRGWLIKLRDTLRISALFILIVVMVSTSLKELGVGKYHFPVPVYNAIRTANLYQNWGLFRNPTSYTYWWVAKAKLENGQYVNLLDNGSEIDFKYERTPCHLFKRNNIWMRHLHGITSVANPALKKEVQERYCRALAHKYQQNHKSKVESVTLYQLWKKVPLDDQQQADGWKIWGKADLTISKGDQ